MSNIVYLCVVFISILILSLFIIQWRIESFVIQETNSIVQAIKAVQYAFEQLASSAKDAKKTTIESKSVADVVKKNIEQLIILMDTYESMDNHDIDPVSSINEIQENLNAYIDIYNYMNDKLQLELPALEKNMIMVPTAQATEKRMMQQLSLPINELNKQLEVQVANKKHTIINSQKPVLSGLRPPPDLIRKITLPINRKEKTKTKTTTNPLPEPPIIDIYDRLKIFIKNK